MTTFEDWIQVAGVIDQAEAEMLCASGVSALGFPLRLPVHREDLQDGDARAIIRRMPRGVSAVLITYLPTADEILSLCDFIGAGAIQLHGAMPVAEIRRLRGLRPDLPLIRSLILGLPGGQEPERTIEDTAPFVDAFLTDSHDPETGAWGATGTTHDWTLSRRLAQASPHPLILAGGLDPLNVRQAIRRVKPAGVDAHTRLEDSGGRKCRRLVEAFVREARAGFAANRRSGFGVKENRR